MLSPRRLGVNLLTSPPSFLCYNSSVKKSLLIGAALLLLIFSLGSSYPPGSSGSVISQPSTLNPELLVRRVNENFQKIRNARADLVLDTNLFLFGCGTSHQLKGQMLFLAPDKLKISSNQYLFVFIGNSIKRVNPQGKVQYFRFIHSPDFSIGFHPGLINHNFYLKTLKERADEVVIEGTPKPGVLKNVTKVIFYIDPQKLLVKKLDIVFTDPSLSGQAEIKYEKIGELWVPTGTSGKSAIETSNGLLIGYSFKLSARNVRINTDVTESDFK